MLTVFPETSRIIILSCRAQSDIASISWRRLISKMQCSFEIFSLSDTKKNELGWQEKKSSLRKLTGCNYSHRCHTVYIVLLNAKMHCFLCDRKQASWCCLSSLPKNCGSDHPGDLKLALHSCSWL